jgi:hypothetical protein
MNAFAMSYLYSGTTLNLSLSLELEETLIVLHTENSANDTVI